MMPMRYARRVIQMVYGARRSPSRDWAVQESGRIAIDEWAAQAAE